MKHDQLISNLKLLKLSGILKDYVETAKASEKLKHTYEEFLLNVTTAELRTRAEQKTRRLIKEAKLPREKHLDTYDFSSREGINHAQMTRLSKGQFVKNYGNVVFFGASGIGKSHLAEALLRNLCGFGYRSLFTTTSNLILDLLTAEKNLTLTHLFKKLDRYDVIAIDELGYTPQTKEAADLFFQFISQRYERKSLVITTNLTYSEWQKVFLNPVTTAAAVDRIIHHCETFNIKGPSFREEYAKSQMIKNKT